MGRRACMGNIIAVFNAHLIDNVIKVLIPQRRCVFKWKINNGLKGKRIGERK